MEKIETTNYKRDLKNRIIVQPKGIHSYNHEVVKQVCDYFGSYKEFGLWLGVAKRIGAGELRERFAYMVGRGIKDSKYLLASCRKQ